MKSQIAFHIVHAAEGDTAAGVASYLSRAKSDDLPGSVQRCVDDNECVRILPDLVIPWGAPPLNTSGIHDELAAWSAWSPLKWYAHLRMLKREAFKIAEDCRTYSIPLRWLDAKQLKAIGANPGKGKGGVTDHVQVSQAFGRSDHTDPGTGFESVKGLAPGRLPPKRLLMFYARIYSKSLGAK